MTYNRCREDPEPVLDAQTGEAVAWPFAGERDPSDPASDWSISDRLCTGPSEGGNKVNNYTKGLGLYTCPLGKTCGNPIYHNMGLETDGVRNDGDILYGLMAFDWLGDALLTIFIMITLEGWT